MLGEKTVATPFLRVVFMAVFCFVCWRVDKNKMSAAGLLISACAFLVRNASARSHERRVMSKGIQMHECRGT